MKTCRFFCLSIITLFFVCHSLNAQKIMLKTNGLEWLCMSPNMGLETRLSKHISLNIEGAGGLAKFGEKRFHHQHFKKNMPVICSTLLVSHLEMSLLNLEFANM